MKILKNIYKHYSDKIRNFRFKKKINELKDKKFSLFSSDCIGGVLYHDLCKQFSSPTINLFFSEHNYSFLNFCLDPDYYCSKDLIFKESKIFPVAQIMGDSNHKTIEINFMHYKTEKKANDDWHRRCNRVEKNKIFIYLKFVLDEQDMQMIEQIDNIFVITSNKTPNKFLVSEKVHCSKYLNKLRKNNGKIMSFCGLIGSRNYDDLKIFDFIYKVI